jgi:hypothetical protein
VQSTSDHQVQNQPEVTLDTNCYSLADSAQFAHDTAFHAVKRRLYGPKQEGACQPDPLDRLRNDTRFERSNIRGDIWQFRHTD